MALFEKSLAVVIGISRLEDGSILVKDTPFAINDAKAIEEILEKKCDFPKSQIHTLYKTQATKQGIIDLITKVAKKTREKDRLLIFFAGHGDSMEIEKTEEGYIVPFDAKGEKGKPKWDSVIGFCDLIELVTNNAKAMQILFLIDSCFSGIACKLMGIDESTRGNKDDLENAAINRKSVEIFTASAKNEKIVDVAPRSEHSLFTKKILEFLNNAKPEEYQDTGAITARRMATVVTIQVTADSWEIGNRQEPQFQRSVKDKTGEFILKKFSQRELKSAADKSEMEFSEIDKLIDEADLYDILLNKDRMLSIIKSSTEPYANRTLSTSKLYSLIFEFLIKDEYVSKQLNKLKQEKGLADSKISEILNHMCITIIASGVKERIILTTIPITAPKRNKENSTIGGRKKE